MLFQQHYSNKTNAFFIDEGGASAEAAKGCSELINELPEVYDHLFCASGTGTTAAGLLNGIHEHQLPTVLHAIPVLKNGGFIADEISKYLHHSGPYQLHANYHFGGYGKTTPELISFIKEFVAATGILIEPVYTGKLFYALFDIARQDYFAPGSSILALHTGGIWGLLGMKNRF